MAAYNINSRVLKLILSFLVLSLALAACSDNPTASNPATTPAVNGASTANTTVANSTVTGGAGATSAITTSAITTTAGATAAATTNPPGTTAAAVPSNTPVPPTATALPPTTTAPTATPAPTVTPKPANLPPRSIEAMRARTYDGGEIKLDRLYEQTSAYTAHLIYYQSDGLRISGLMMVPNGPKDQKYPVALVNHGYFNPPEYDSGWDTIRELRYFARNGYITIASDYRNYARSDKGDNDRTPGYTDDILNLIEAVKKFPQADPSKITIMGHSMGGEITLNALVVSKDIKVAALFGSMSADAADNYYARIKWRGGDTPEKAIYGDPAQNAETYRLMSPLTYFQDITAPVIIHSGTNDTTTPPAWSEKIYKALQSLNKTTEFYSYKGEGHSLNGAAFDTAMARTLAFFNKALNR
ncbi:MAG TPA: alpha/beta fold hydrolase [Chloroflexia bacterium]|nr:alpha/beta fold hydrolase [Chloroflexia bacterium]